MYAEISRILKEKNKYLANLIDEIDKMLYIDSNSTIVKGRTIGEIVTKIISEEEGLDYLLSYSQMERINILFNEDLIPPDIQDSLHTVRMIGNKAVHDKVEGAFENSLVVNRNIYKIISWFIIVYVDHSYEEVTYIEPKFIEKINVPEIKVDDITDKIVERLLERLNIESLINKQLIKFDNNEIKKETVATIENKDKSDCNFNEIKSKLEIQVKEGGSPYIVYCRERLRQVIDEENWTFSKGDRVITIYNNRFRELMDSINVKLPSKINLQFWMKRPFNEYASLQVEIAGGGLDCKQLRVELSNSLKSKFNIHEDIQFSKPNAGVVMTLKIPAIGIKDSRCDTMEILEKNTDNIEAAIVKFISYFNERIVNNWIEFEARKVINNYIENNFD